MTTTTAHDLTLDPRRPGARFSGSCSCGARVDDCTTAGMVHGWHAGHRDDVEVEAFAADLDRCSCCHLWTSHDVVTGACSTMACGCGHGLRPAFVPASSLRPGDEIPDVDEWGNPTVAVVLDVTTVGRRTVLRLDTATALSVPASRTYEVER